MPLATLGARTPVLIGAGSLALVVLITLVLLAVSRRRRRRHDGRSVTSDPRSGPAPAPGRASASDAPAPGTAGPQPPSRVASGTTADLGDRLRRREGATSTTRPARVTAENPFTARLRADTTHRVPRAAAAAEAAIELLHGVRATDAPLLSTDLAIAMEATVSAWLVDERVTASDVVGVLHPGGAPPHPVTARIADGLRQVLVADGTPTWDLVAAFARRLGRSVPMTEAPSTALARTSPADLAGEAAAALSLGGLPMLGATGAPAGRALLAAWPARSGHLDAVPLIISPSLAAADPPTTATPSDEDLLVVLLAAVEDAAFRQLRVEQAVAGLQRRYLDELVAEVRADDTAPHAEQERWHGRLVAALFAHPVVDLATLVAAGGDPSPSAVAPTRRAMSSFEARGWVRSIDGPPGSDRWLAAELVRVAWGALAQPVGERPLVIDLTTSAARADGDAHRTVTDLGR